MGLLKETERVIEEQNALSAEEAKKREAEREKQATLISETVRNLYTSWNLYGCRQILDELKFLVWSKERKVGIEGPLLRLGEDIYKAVDPNLIMMSCVEGKSQSDKGTLGAAVRRSLGDNQQPVLFARLLTYRLDESACGDISEEREELSRISLTVKGLSFKIKDTPEIKLPQGDSDHKAELITVIDTAVVNYLRSR